MLRNHFLPINLVLTEVRNQHSMVPRFRGDMLITQPKLIPYTLNRVLI
jgi:hypothetical protein